MELYQFNRDDPGKIFGPATGKGNDMAMWVLKANGNVFPRCTMCPLHVDELQILQKVMN